MARKRDCEPDAYNGGTEAERTKLCGSLECPSTGGYPGGGTNPGSKSFDASKGDGLRAGGGNVTSSVDPDASRHPEGVPTSDDLVAGIQSAFLTGDPHVAYQATQRLVAAHRSLQTEAAKLRFQVNFGTARCDNCTGLHAGPGVVATCFQVKRCDFSNIRAGSEDSVLRRLVDGLHTIK